MISKCNLIEKDDQIDPSINFKKKLFDSTEHDQIYKINNRNENDSIRWDMLSSNYDSQEKNYNDKFGDKFAEVDQILEKNDTILNSQNPQNSMGFNNSQNQSNLFNKNSQRTNINNTIKNSLALQSDSIHTKILSIADVMPSELKNINEKQKQNQNQNTKQGDQKISQFQNYNQNQIKQQQQKKKTYLKSKIHFQFQNIIQDLPTRRFKIITKEQYKFINDLVYFFAKKVDLVQRQRSDMQSQQLIKINKQISKKLKNTEKAENDSNFKIKIKKYYKLLKKGELCNIIINPQNNIALGLNIFFSMFTLFWLFLFSLDIFYVRFKNIDEQYQENNYKGGLEDINIHAFTATFIIFSLEILYKSHISFFELGKLIKDRTRIFKKYKSEELLFDLISLIIIFLLIVFQGNFASNEIADRLIKSIFFIKVVNFFKITLKIENSLYLKGIRSHYIQLACMLFQLVMMCHWIGSVWNLISILEMDYLNSNDSWLTQQNISDKGIHIVYAESFYWALATICLIGTKGFTFFETSYTIVVLVMTVGVFAYILSTISMIIEDLNKEITQYKSDLEIINRYMKAKNVDKDVQQQVRSYIEYLFHDSKELSQTQQAQQVLEKFPENLREEILSSMNNKIFNNFWFITKNFTHKTQDRVKKYIKENDFVTNQKIFRQDQSSEIEMHIITKGQIEILRQTDDRVYKTLAILKPGDIIGDQNFISGQNYVVTAKSLSYSTTISINRNDFMCVLKQSQVDLEKFLMIKQQIILNKTFKFYQPTCKICRKQTHFSTECNLLVYRPISIYTFLKNQHSVPNQRVKYFRALQVKQNSLFNNNDYDFPNVFKKLAVSDEFLDYLEQFTDDDEFDMGYDDYDFDEANFSPEFMEYFQQMQLYSGQNTSQNMKSRQSRQFRAFQNFVKAQTQKTDPNLCNDNYNIDYQDDDDLNTENINKKYNNQQQKKLEIKENSDSAQTDSDSEFESRVPSKNVIKGSGLQINIQDSANNSNHQQFKQRDSVPETPQVMSTPTSNYESFNYKNINNNNNSPGVSKRSKQNILENLNNTTNNQINQSELQMQKRNSSTLNMNLSLQNNEVKKGFLVKKKSAQLSSSTQQIIEQSRRASFLAQNGIRFQGNNDQQINQLLNRQQQGDSTPIKINLINKNQEENGVSPKNGKGKIFSHINQDLLTLNKQFQSFAQKIMHVNKFQKILSPSTPSNDQNTLTTLPTYSKLNSKTQNFLTAKSFNIFNPQQEKLKQLQGESDNQWLFFNLDKQNPWRVYYPQMNLSNIVIVYNNLMRIKDLQKQKFSRKNQQRQTYLKNQKNTQGNFNNKYNNNSSPQYQ